MSYRIHRFKIVQLELRVQYFLKVSTFKYIICIIYIICVFHNLCYKSVFLTTTLLKKKGEKTVKDVQKTLNMKVIFIELHSMNCIIQVFTKKHNILGT